MKEKRKYERYDLQLPSNIYTQYKGQKNHIQSKTCNISSGGAFFFTKTPLEEGTKVEVELLLPIKNIHPGNDYSVSIVKASGAVVRAELKGMAVCFDATYTIKPEWSTH